MRFRKKPVIIDAVQFTGRNHAEMINFTDGKAFFEDSYRLIIKTLEGEMLASDGDWIIKGVKGEFYPCKPDIFEQSYDKVEA